MYEYGMGCQTIIIFLNLIASFMACSQSYHFAFENSFSVHIYKVKQFLPVYLDGESNANVKTSVVW